MRITGIALTDAETVAVRFDDIGTGYWVVPVGAPDSAEQRRARVGDSAADFGNNLPIGFRHLLFAATDKTGQSGQQLSLEVCTMAPYPDNLNACRPEAKPPQAIVSWCGTPTPILDVLLETPSGSVVWQEHPTPSRSARWASPSTALAPPTTALSTATELQLRAR